MQDVTTELKIRLYQRPDAVWVMEVMKRQDWMLQSRGETPPQAMTNMAALWLKAELWFKDGEGLG